METGVAGGVSFALTPEQRELRALAREFAEKEIRPKAAEYDEHSTHPADVIAKAHELGLMNLHVPESLGGLGPARLRRDARRRGAELGLLRASRTSIVANGSARLPSSSRARTSRRRRGCRRSSRSRSSAPSGSQRAGRGLGRRAHEDDRRAQRRRVRPERLEDVHHERRPGGVDGRLREDGPEPGPPGASRPSSCPMDRRASRSRSTSTRWASARRTRPRSP